MQKTGVRPTDLAQLLDVSPISVIRYRNGQRVPRPDVMRRIVEITGGAVRPDDFCIQEEMKS